MPANRLEAGVLFSAGRKATRGTVEQAQSDRRCLVIDPQPTVRLGVRQLLDPRYAVEEAEDWRGGLEILHSTGGFIVAVVDMGRADGADVNGHPGTAAIRALRRAQPGLGIVAHGARAERHAAAEAIDAGATGFVAKSSRRAAWSEPSMPQPSPRPSSTPRRARPARSSRGASARSSSSTPTASRPPPSRTGSG